MSEAEAGGVSEAKRPQGPECPGDVWTGLWSQTEVHEKPGWLHPPSAASTTVLSSVSGLGKVTPSQPGLRGEAMQGNETSVGKGVTPACLKEPAAVPRLTWGCPLEGSHGLRRGCLLTPPSEARRTQSGWTVSPSSRHYTAEGQGAAPETSPTGRSVLSPLTRSNYTAGDRADEEASTQNRERSALGAAGVRGPVPTPPLNHQRRPP